ncbi:hypothetical protein [Mesorhizobium sp. CO1-1-8]|uniref:hypothetical protein n=1 Tax=Mesorhizobium sp. CO1-1-8 TaxID=2876631 RepID=UPI001CD0BC68|nr:hypothetical protein [Mesorhizobium sp. CO1-1-8]MBZ9774008.1 hypothetical protein [Mesorhizobium sp. CO1-1-8]
MVGWVRYSMWDRWRDLTRFRLACEMALDSYKAYVNDFPVSSPSPMIVHDPSGDSGFKCVLDDFKQVLNDGEVLYRTLYPTYVALTEDLARELVERLVADKGVARTSFAGMKAGNISEAAERYVTDVAMEIWGDAILKASGRDWSGIKGSKRAVVEAVTVRNLCAHGIPVFNRKAINRIAAAAGRNIAVKEGDPIKLDKKRFTNYTATLRAFARALADGVTSLPDVKKGS